MTVPKYPAIGSLRNVSATRIFCNASTSAPVAPFLRACVKSAVLVACTEMLAAGSACVLDALEDNDVVEIVLEVVAESAAVVLAVVVVATLLVVAFVFALVDAESASAAAAICDALPMTTVRVAVPVSPALLVASYLMV